MAVIRNVSGQDREVPLGFARPVVPAGGTLTVPDDDVESFVSQSEVWQLAKPNVKEK
mgnify:CR=1 FL=1